MREKTYLIGVDTGGTYTDAVVVDADDHRVLATSKALTTRGDLSIGVGEAIRAAVARLPAGLDPAAISMVAVSTTLATNAVVEGHGGPVCVVLVGFDETMASRTGIAAAFPGMPVEIIAGGHDHNGNQRAALDEAALAEVIARHGGTVEAFAVASQFAVRNPAHEHRARALIQAATGKPVTLSTELSSALDAPRRALTAALNARLISRISMLIAAVHRAMSGLGIAAPLMIVKGDGSLALAERVALRPIETVLSGPAASLVGARWLSGADSFILSDMGGTTTDLGILLDGRPKVTDEGADLGGWRTMVRAIDVRTVGLGGDSEVSFPTDGRIVIGPARMVPVSLLGARFPEVLDLLDNEVHLPDVSSQSGRYVIRPLGQGEDLSPPPGLPPKEAEILARVGHRPVPVSKIAVSPSATRLLASLRRKGLVQIAGFTPSDAAHVLDMQANWSAEAARSAARLAVRFREMRQPTAERVEALCREVWSQTVRITGRLILETAVGRSLENDPLVDGVCRGEPQVGLARVSIAPSVPVVAVGGPVKVYYGEVGRRLGAEMLFPENCDVANAVGAATGQVSARIAVSIAGDGSGVYRVHGPDGTQMHGSGPAALGAAEMIARSAAEAAARAEGAVDPIVRISIEKRNLPGMTGDEGLFTALVEAEASGGPRVAGDQRPQ